MVSIIVIATIAAPIITNASTTTSIESREVSADVSDPIYYSGAYGSSVTISITANAALSSYQVNGASVDFDKTKNLPLFISDELVVFNSASDGKVYYCTGSGPTSTNNYTQVSGTIKVLNEGHGWVLMDANNSPIYAFESAATWVRYIATSGDYVTSTASGGVANVKSLNDVVTAAINTQAPTGKKSDVFYNGAQ